MSYPSRSSQARVVSCIPVQVFDCPLRNLPPGILPLAGDRVCAVRLIRLVLRVSVPLGGARFSLPSERSSDLSGVGVRRRLGDGDACPKPKSSKSTKTIATYASSALQDAKIAGRNSTGLFDFSRSDRQLRRVSDTVTTSDIAIATLSGRIEQCYHHPRWYFSREVWKPCRSAPHLRPEYQRMITFSSCSSR